jgi:cysteine desulfurase
VLPVDGAGLVDPADLEKVITDRTLLVTVMHSNNEVGTIQPIAELAAIARHHGALMHTDAAQSIGKEPIKVDDLGVDLLSLAGHKLYAPKGIGALYLQSGLEPVRLMHGASHENGRRPGTENVLEIVGLGAACEIISRDLQDNRRHFTKMRDRLHQGLLRELGQDAVRLNGHPELRLANTLSVSFRGIEANALVADIGDAVAASAGAACHADGVELSVVLKEMKIPVEWAMGTLRLTTGRSTTADDIDQAVSVVSAAVRRLRGGLA